MSDKTSIIFAWIDWAANQRLSAETFASGCELLETDWEYYADKGFYSLESAARYLHTDAPASKQEIRIIRC